MLEHMKRTFDLNLYLSKYIPTLKSCSLALNMSLADFNGIGINCSNFSSYYMVLIMEDWLNMLTDIIEESFFGKLYKSYLIYSPSKSSLSFKLGFYLFDFFFWIYYKSGIFYILSFTYCFFSTSFLSEFSSLVFESDSNFLTFRSIFYSVCYKDIADKSISFKIG